MKGILAINKFISLEHNCNIIHPQKFMFDFSDTKKIPVRIGYWYSLDYYFLLSNNSSLNGFSATPLLKLSNMKYSYYITRKNIKTLADNKKLIPVCSNLKFI